MTDEERARKILEPILSDGGSSGDKETDEDMISDLAAEFAAVRTEALGHRSEITKLADAIDDALNHHVGSSDEECALRIPRHRSELIAEMVNAIACVIGPTPLQARLRVRTDVVRE